MVDAALFSSATGEWETPPEEYSKWDEEFHFTFDAASSHLNHKAERYATKDGVFLMDSATKISDLDGLSYDWSQEEAIWCNPEYGDPENACVLPHSKCKKKKCEERGYHNDEYKPGVIDWVKKAYETYLTGKPRVIVFLLPSRTDTGWWHPYVEEFAEKRFIKGRLKFGGAKNSAPFPSVLVIWRPRERQQ